MDSNDYTTLTSAADSAGVPVSTLRYWIESGRLPATSSERGRLVRLSDVQQLIDSHHDTAVEATERPSDGTDPASEGIDSASNVITVAVEDASIAVAHTAERSAVRRRRHVIAANMAAFIAKLDELYRAQIAAKDGEIATKDELIVELRRRAEHAERQVALVEQKLSEEQARLAAAQAHGAAPAHTHGAVPVSRPGLLARFVTWYMGR